MGKSGRKTTKSVFKGKEKASERVGALSKAGNEYVDALLGTPAELSSVNPKGQPLNVGVIRHSKVITLRDQGSYEFHPVLSNSMLTCDTASTAVTRNAPFAMTLEGKSGGSVRAFPPSSEEMGDGISDVLPEYDMELPGGVHDTAIPLSVDGSIVGSEKIPGLTNRLGWKVGAVNGDVDADVDLHFDFNKPLMPGQNIAVHLLARGSTDRNTTLGTITGAGQLSASLSVSGETIARSSEGQSYFELEITPSQGTVEVKDFSFVINVTSGEVTFTSGRATLGIDAEDLEDIAAVVKTGKVALLGMQAWLEFNGTMQQNGSLAHVVIPASSTGAAKMSRETVTALQKDHRTAYNGKLQDGVIMLGSPINEANYGKLQDLLTFNEDWYSHYGAYSAVSTAAGGALPQINMKLQMVLGYYPNNRIVKPIRSHYSGAACMEAFAFWSEMGLVYENTSHVEKIKKALGKAANVVETGIAVASKVAKFAALAASFL